MFLKHLRNWWLWLLILFLSSCVSKHSIFIDKAIDYNNDIESQTFYIDRSSIKKGNDIIEISKQYIGVKYTYGGESPEEGFDCSGFVQYVYKKIGIDIPRTVSEIYKNTVRIDNIREGDLVFFSIKNVQPDHIGIMIDKEHFIHASLSRGVTISSLKEQYYKKHLKFIRRVYLNKKGF